MPLFCIQCALKAYVEGRQYLGDGEESNDAHRQRCHPDPVATQRERYELERLAAEKMKNDPDARPYFNRNN